MINIKSPEEIALMREAGRIAKNALILGGKLASAGIRTSELDARIEDYIRSHGAVPSFKGYGDFPASACISINEEVIHGIPGSRKLREGDIVSIDVGAYLKGYHGDCAATFPVGRISAEAAHLIEVTRTSFYRGLRKAVAGNRISDISHEIQVYAESNGCSVVRTYVGHGVGTQLHEDPEVPNFGEPGHGPRLIPGMTIAVEPMINLGTHAIRRLSDGWTVKTADGKLSAHYENTLLITDAEPEILTAGDEDI